ncbi:MAG: PEP-CTERM sorting domain-containing protein [Akkermansia sp.]
MICAAILSSVCAYATDTLTAEVTSGGDLLHVSDAGYFWNLQDTTGVTRPAGTGNAWAGVPQTSGTTYQSEGSVYQKLTTLGNTDYNLSLGGTNVDFKLSSNVYINGLSTVSGLTSTTIRFSGGTLTSSGSMNFGSSTITLDVSAIAAEDDISKTTLLSSDRIYGFGIDFDNLTLSGGSMDYKGVLFYNRNAKKYYNSADISISNGYYGVKDGATAVTIDQSAWGSYLVADITANSGASIKSLSYLTVVPEPATATLSLLALAGLAARRRRH